MNRNGNVNMETNERKRLLKTLDAEEFSLWETALYLDGHPTDTKALAFYRHQCSVVEELAKQFRERFGPIDVRDCGNGETWSWVEGPWPWEKEAN